MGDERGKAARKGANGVSTNGVTANFVFFDRGTFGVLPLTYFHLPKSARAYLFPQSVKRHYFCSGTISLDPICPQPSGVLPGLRTVGPGVLAEAETLNALESGQCLLVARAPPPDRVPGIKTPTLEIMQLAIVRTGFVPCGLDPANALPGEPQPRRSRRWPQQRRRAPVHRDMTCFNLFIN